MDSCEKFIVRFCHHAVPDQPDLMPCRNGHPEDQQIMKFYFITTVDSYWAVNLVYNSYAASGEGYEMSYGQVWLALLYP